MCVLSSLSLNNDYERLNDGRLFAPVPYSSSRGRGGAQLGGGSMGLCNASQYAPVKENAGLFILWSVDGPGF